MPHKYLSLLILLFLLFLGCTDWNQKNINGPEDRTNKEEYQYRKTHPIAESGKKQIGIITTYDTGYYQGGYPLKDRGACTDVIEQALRDNGYDLKAKIDEDMKNHPDKYPHDPDPNINYRRVRNVKIFLDQYAEKLPTCIKNDCFQKGNWHAGDIVTFDQIPGSLWHIAIISDKTINTEDGTLVPFLIHNYGHGVVEDNMLRNWPAPITGHYRLREFDTRINSVLNQKPYDR